MKILKFEGASMREALAKVKAELGDQAVIVSSRQLKKGLLGHAYEIAAAIDDDLPPAPVTRAPAAPSGIGRGLVAAAAPPRRPGLDDEDVERLVAPLRAELRSLRAIVRARADEKPARLEQELAGLRRALEELRGGAPAPATAPATDRRTSDDLAAPSRASTVMLVGPTGVGKTTTIAKIAAQAALVEGKRVALVTLDNYRVGGIDQIRTFADLIGVPLYVVEDPAALALQLEELAGYDLTLVDTAGKSPRDDAALAKLATALAGLRQIEVHLTVAAATPADQLDDIHGRFAVLRPSRLLFTKVDECRRAPELAQAPVRLRLPVTWLATGQAVPEDLEVASAVRLIELARQGLRGREAA